MSGISSRSPARPSSRPLHVHPSDLTAASRLTIEAITGITHLVEAVHHTIVRTPRVFGAAPAGSTRGITGLVYRSIRGITRGVGVALDTALAPLVPLLQPATDRVPSPQRAAALAALNGVLGDTLAGHGSTLALPMQLRHAGQPLTLTRAALAAAVPQARGELLVLVHGLCMSDTQWLARLRRTDPRGPRWLRDPRRTVLTLSYNTGLPVAANGRALDQLLGTLCAQWPQPVSAITLVAHSMGGLVARSACEAARQTQAAAGADWRSRLRTLVCLGTPHLGAPLERGGHGIDLLLGASPYSAPFARLGRLRSAGITDLRHGQVADVPCATAVPLPVDVDCFSLAVSHGRRAGDARDRLLGDGLVPVDSALGRHADPARALRFAPARTAVLYGLDHLDLLGHPRVQAQLDRWLPGPARGG